MKYSYINFSTLILIACLLFCPERAPKAQGNELPTPKAPFFVPTSGWLVGPATPNADAAPGMPCLMATLYNNGYHFRISADDSRIFAVAIDFHQPAFTPNEAYKLTLSIPGGFEEDLKASAYNRSTLIVNTRSHPDLYQAIRNGDLLTLEIGSRKIDFALLSAAEGLSRVAACSRGDATSQQTSKTLLGEEGMAADMAVRYKEWGHENVAQAIPPTPEVEAEDRVGGNGAGTPDGAGVGAMIAGAAATIKDTVLPLANKSRQREGVFPDKSKQASKSHETSGSDILVNYDHAVATEVSESEGAVRRWRAMRGANMREILSTWTHSDNSRLVWNAGRDFPIVESLTVQGSFEAAVEALLQQYKDEVVRPVGKIYRNGDELDGRVLLIELAGE